MWLLHSAQAAGCTAATIRSVNLQSTVTGSARPDALRLRGEMAHGM